MTYKAVRSMRICPISSGIPASKGSWMSLVNSMKKRKVKMSVRQRPKKKPLPAFFLPCR